MAENSKKMGKEVESVRKTLGELATFDPMIVEEAVRESPEWAVEREKSLGRTNIKIKYKGKSKFKGKFKVRMEM